MSIGTALLTWRLMYLVGLTGPACAQCEQLKNLASMGELTTLLPTTPVKSPSPMSLHLKDCPVGRVNSRRSSSDGVPRVCHAVLDARSLACCTDLTVVSGLQAADFTVAGPALLMVIRAPSLAGLTWDHASLSTCKWQTGGQGMRSVRQGGSILRG